MRWWVITLLVSTAHSALAQDLVRTPGILANDVTNLQAAGNAIWVGPYLNVSRDDGATWEAANADSLRGFATSVYSIDREGDILWAGLGSQSMRTGSDGQTQAVNEVRGLLQSADAGHTWTYVSYLPRPDSDPVTTGLVDLPEDTLISYGAVQLPTLAISVTAQSPPWDLDYDHASGTLWVAGQLAGLRRSTDQGTTWERIVLPPDTTAFLAPELGYQFPFFVQPVNVAPDQFFGLNFQVFAVLVDATGTVWAGTAGGLNRSDDGGVRWHHYTSEHGLAGNWVISIEEQTRPGQTPAIWSTNWPGTGEAQRYGVSVTRDRGATFERVLSGQHCFDFAFEGTSVYAACRSGLYISHDDGNVFVAVRDFVDRTDPSRTIRPGAPVYAVEVANGSLWAGTADGLFRSTDRGRTWDIHRTTVPLDPEGLSPVIPADQVPRVESYAYPNPFSPGSDRLIRLRYRLPRAGTVMIRVFDFGMNPVRQILNAHQEAGEQEVSWDGTDEYGARLANGPYFYAVRSGGATYWGKILIVE